MMNTKTVKDQIVNLLLQIPGRIICCHEPVQFPDKMVYYGTAIHSLGNTELELRIFFIVKVTANKISVEPQTSIDLRNEDEYEFWDYLLKQACPFPRTDSLYLDVEKFINALADIYYSSTQDEGDQSSIYQDLQFRQYLSFFDNLKVHFTKDKISDDTRKRLTKINQKDLARAQIDALESDGVMAKDQLKHQVMQFVHLVNQKVDAKGFLADVRNVNIKQAFVFNSLNLDWMFHLIAQAYIKADKDMKPICLGSITDQRIMNNAKYHLYLSFATSKKTIVYLDAVCEKPTADHVEQMTLSQKFKLDVPAEVLGKACADTPKTNIKNHILI